MKHYYALSDSFAGDCPREFTYGFANTKTALAFHTKAERDAWLDDTRLLTAKAIPRKEAMRLCRDSICPIYGTGEDYDSRGHRVYGTGEYLVFDAN